jgi:hypothetical protein
MTPDSYSSSINVVYEVIFFIFLVLPYFLLSRLTKIEHDNFPDQWEKDGRPHGLPFWYPIQEFEFLGFRSYPGFMGTLWLFVTPNWVKEHSTASKLIWFYRFFLFFDYMILLGVCLLLFLPLVIN